MFWLRLLISCALIAAGFTAAETWERRPAQPGGFIQRFLGTGLAAQRDDWRRQAIEAQAGVAGWRERATTCESKRPADTDRRAGQVSKDSSSADARAGSAYDTGFRAGRLAGVHTCGTDHATPALPAPGVGPDGLRDDFSTSFNANLYKPAT